jgi:hypothetical protein
VQTTVVPPIDPLEGRQLELDEVGEGTAVGDELGLVEADHAFGHGVVVAVAAAPISPRRSE